MISLFPQEGVGFMRYRPPSFVSLSKGVRISRQPGFPTSSGFHRIADSHVCEPYITNMFHGFGVKGAGCFNKSVLEIPRLPERPDKEPPIFLVV